jgi:hypothetical protein
MRLFVLVILGSGCTAVENEPLPNPTATLDEAAFRCNVEPVLVKQCSYGACHGKADSALRVYSPGKLRATTPTNNDDANAALTEAERHANYTSAAGFAVATAPADNWLLLKPLPATLGGYEHLGGEIYTGTTDPQFTAISAWLGGSKSCN